MAFLKKLAARTTILLLVLTCFSGILGNALPKNEIKEEDCSRCHWDHWDDCSDYCKDNICDRDDQGNYSDFCGLAVGIIIAIVVGVLVLIIGSIILCCCCCGLLCFAGRKSAQTV